MGLLHIEGHLLPERTRTGALTIREDAGAAGQQAGLSLRINGRSG